MNGSFTWKKGKDGTQYYVESANGHVAGTVQTADNGSDIFKVGFGGEFVALYDKEANAKAAIEKMAKASASTQGLMATQNAGKATATSRASKRIAK